MGDPQDPRITTVERDPPLQAGEAQPSRTPQTAAQQEEDVVEVITNLLATPAPTLWRDGTHSTPSQVGREEPDPEVATAQQCSEHEPPLGWPYSPMSPRQVFASPGEERRVRGEDRPGEGDTTPTLTQGMGRSGPDYAWRDYMQGGRVSMPQAMWPYSPLTPNTPGPRSHPSPPA